MGEANPALTSAHDAVESLTCSEEMALESAIAKLVILGKQVDVDAGQMIALLESGLSVVELVEYLASRNTRCLCD